MASALSQRGDVLVSQTQRARMLSSAVEVIAEHGYAEMSVARVTGRAGVSRRTFYDLFEDREDCFLAVFEETVARASSELLAGYRAESDWLAQTRAGLLALLRLLDRERGVGVLLVVDVLKAGPKVLQRRAQILEQLSSALHESGSRAAAEGAPTLPALTGEGVTGAVLGVIHSRLLAARPASMVTLLNPLMSMIVLPYLGADAARAEVARPTPELARSGSQRVIRRDRPGDPLAGLPMRITYRTLLVLGVIGGHPGVSNREAADAAGISDQGQISKLLARLQTLGLIENTAAGQPSGEPNQWRLTHQGRHVHQALRGEGIARATRPSPGSSKEASQQ